MTQNLEAFQNLYVAFGGSLDDHYDDIANGVAVGDYCTTADVIFALAKIAAPAPEPVMAYIKDTGVLYKEVNFTTPWKKHEIIDAVYAANGQMRITSMAVDLNIVVPTTVKSSSDTLEWLALTMSGAKLMKYAGAYSKISADGDAGSSLASFTLTPDA